MKKFRKWEVEDIEVDNVDGSDYPDFADAYISAATVNGEEVTEEQLDTLNDDSDFLYDCVNNQIF